MSVITSRRLRAALLCVAFVHSGLASAAETDLRLLANHDATAYTNDPVFYQMTVTNLSGDTAEGVTVTFRHTADTPLIAAGGAGWTCTTGDGGGGAIDEICSLDTSLPGWESAYMSVEIHATPYPGWFSPAIWVASTTPDPELGNNYQNPQTTVQERGQQGSSADLGVSVAHSTVGYQGEEMTFDATVTNYSADAASEVLLRLETPQDMPLVAADGDGWSCTKPDYVECRRGAVAGQQSSSVRIVLRAPNYNLSAYAAAIVSAATADPEPSNNTFAFQFQVQERAPLPADIAVSVPHPGEAYTGDTIRYRVSVSNLTADTSGAVTMSGYTPPEGSLVSVTPGPGWTCEAQGISCSRPSLAGGETGTVEVVMQVTASEGSWMSPWFNAYASGDDPDYTNNHVQTGTYVRQRPVDPPTETDLQLTAQYPNPVYPDEPVRYDLTVTNLSAGTAEGVVVTFRHDGNTPLVSAGGGNWICSTASGGGGAIDEICHLGPSLAGGASAPLTIVARSTPFTGWFSPAIWVSSSTPDPQTGNNYQNPQITVNERPPAGSNVNLGITHDSRVRTSAPIQYNLSVQNLGPDAATDTGVIFVHPADTPLLSIGGDGWACRTVASGSDRQEFCDRAEPLVGTAPLLIVVIQAPSSEGNFAPSIGVHASNDPAGYKYQNALTTVANDGDSKITLQVLSYDSQVYTRDPVHYNLAVINQSGAAATGVALVFRHSVHMPLLSAGGDGWTCTSAPNGRYSIEETCRRDAALPAYGAAQLGVVIEAPQDEGYFMPAIAVKASNDPSEIQYQHPQTSVLPRNVDLAAELTDSADPVRTGAELTYAVGVHHIAGDSAHDVTALLQLPAGVEVLRITGAGWTCSGTGTLSCAYADWLMPQNTASFQVTVRAPAQNGQITATATVASRAHETDPSNDSASQATTVLSCVPQEYASGEPTPPSYKVQAPGGKKVQVKVDDGKCVQIDEQIKLP
jgi:hypothetical protein